MDHIAIMRKSWKLTEKVLSGEKTIESRWYVSRRAPWDRIKGDDTVYFKDSGSPVTVKAKVRKVLQFSDLNKDKVTEIFSKYYKEDGIRKSEIPRFANRYKDKRYCMLIFLKDAKRVEPFNISKKGYGIMSAWMVVNDIEKVRR